MADYCQCRGGTLKCSCGFCGMRSDCCHPTPSEPHQPTVEKPTIEGFIKKYGRHGPRLLFSAYREAVEHHHVDIQFRDSLGREIAMMIDDLTESLKNHG